MTTGTPRENFDQRIQALFDLENPDAQSLFSFVQRHLYQFRMGNTYEVKDILVEVYARGVKLTETGVAIEIPTAWCRRTAYNVIREYRRELNDFKDWNIEQEPYLEGADALSEKIHAEDLQTIRLAFKRLEPEERRILHLRIVKKMSWREVGQCLVQTASPAHSENALRQKGFRALKKLRELYEEERKKLPIDLDEIGRAHV